MEETKRAQFETEIQGLATDLLQQASEIQTSISTAKTGAKKAFYKKKMAKVSKELQQILSISELMKLTGVTDDTTSTSPTT